MKFPTSVTRFVAMRALKVRKHSPEILFAAGVTGAVTSTVLACKATLKLEEVLDEHAKTAIQIDEVVNLGKDTYTDKDAQQDRVVLTLQSAQKVAKLYAPAVILGAISLGCLTQSHRIMSQRNAAITAAYVAVDKAFREYRERVINDFGEDKDREYRYGKQHVEVVDKSGKKKTALKAGPIQGTNQYAKLFDETSKYWKSVSEYNVTYLQGVQHQANAVLNAKGYLFLNDVYDWLGIPRTKAGQVVGWLSDRHPNHGDGYVDLGFMDMEDDRIRDFLLGFEGGIMLDFNVDGPIWEMI